MKRWKWVIKFPGGGAGWEEMRADEDPRNGFVHLPDVEVEIEKERTAGVEAGKKLCIDVLRRHPRSGTMGTAIDLLEYLLLRSGDSANTVYDHHHDADTYLLHSVLFPKTKMGKVSVFERDMAQPQVVRETRDKLNILVDVVDDLLRRMNEISPGNRP